MRILLFAFIFLGRASAFLSNPVLPDANPFVAIFGGEQPLTAIEKYFRDFSKTYLLTSLANQGSLSQVVTELASFDFDSLDLNWLGMLSEKMVTQNMADGLSESVASQVTEREQTLMDEVHRVCGIHEKIILTGKMTKIAEAMLPSLKKLAQDVLLRAIQLGYTSRLPDFVLTQEILAGGVAQFAHETVKSPGMINTVGMAEYLAGELATHTKDLISTYINFLEFQNAPFGVFSDFLTAVIKMIQQRKIAVTPVNQESSLSTLTELIGICSSLRQTDNGDGSTFIADFARTHLLPSCRTGQLSLRKFFQMLYGNVLAMFVRTHSRSNLLEAKRLYIEYFLPEDYAIPTTEYIRFLMVKYLEEGFKEEAVRKETWYTKLREVYIVDLLHASTEHHSELMTESEVRKVLEGFAKTTDTLTATDMANFNLFRRLLLRNSELLDRYEQFFSSFYNAGLFFVEYCAFSLENGRAEGRFAVTFDRFLTTCWKRDGGFWNSIFNGRLPDDSVFDISATENYPAYKLINMQAAPGDFVGRSVSFASYADLEDKNIEELLFENSKFSDLALTIKELYLNNRALNFGAFSGLEVDARLWVRLRELNPELFTAGAVDII